MRLTLLFSDNPSESGGELMVCLFRLVAPSRPHHQTASNLFDTKRFSSEYVIVECVNCLAGLLRIRHVDISESSDVDVHSGHASVLLKQLPKVGGVDARTQISDQQLDGRKTFFGRG